MTLHDIFLLWWAYACTGNLPVSFHWRIKFVRSFVLTQTNMSVGSDGSYISVVLLTGGISGQHQHPVSGPGRRRWRRQPWRRRRQQQRTGRRCAAALVVRPSAARRQHCRICGWAVISARNVAWRQVDISRRRRRRTVGQLLPRLITRAVLRILHWVRQDRVSEWVGFNVPINTL